LEAAMRNPADPVAKHLSGGTPMLKAREPCGGAGRQVPSHAVGLRRAAPAGGPGGAGAALGRGAAAHCRGAAHRPGSSLSFAPASVSGFEPPRGGGAAHAPVFLWLPRSQRPLADASERPDSRAGAQPRR
jgi:hypothetical protein